MKVNIKRKEVMNFTLLSASSSSHLCLKRKLSIIFFFVYPFLLLMIETMATSLGRNRVTL